MVNNKDYVVNILKIFNRGIRKSSYYKGKSSFFVETVGGCTYYKLWLPLKRDIEKCIIDRVVVNFKYLETIEGKYICFERGDFIHKDIVSGERVFIEDLGCVICNDKAYKVIQGKYPDSRYLTGHLYIVRCKNSNKYNIEGVILF